MDSLAQEIRISGPQVVPFTERQRTVCPACGMSSDYLWRRILRRIRGKAIREIVGFRYCPGEKAPTEERQDMMSVIFHGSREVTNKCAGLFHPHLHATCAACHAEWFTELKNSGVR